MKWKKFTIETTTEAVDLISEALHELGVEGIEIEDPGCCRKTFENYFELIETLYEQRK